MPNATSEYLARNADRIMRTWEQRALKEISAAKNQESLALWNSLPEYLDQLADALSSTIDRSEARVKADRIESERVGRKHGRERAGSVNYTMDQLIREYHILRQVVCSILEEEAVLTSVEREVIVASVEQAVNDAATQFSDTLRDIQEKFTHTLAHDLRGPITTAKSSAQLILRRPDDVDHCIRTASRISNSMDRLDSMIHDLLDASRLRAGQTLLLQFKECDLDLLARQVADEFNSEEHGEHGNWGNRVIVVSSGQCPGYWSESGLRRVLENLVTNAIKYGAPSAPITIRIVGAKETVLLSIHNEGKPIPQEEQAILFQQFRRSATAEKKPGWGLGLTLVQGMTEAHHGTIQVDSLEGKGTTFTIELPRDARAQSAHRRRRPKGPTQDPSSGASFST